MSLRDPEHPVREFEESGERVPAFFYLLRVAFEASEAVDYFDLTDDPESRRRFATLQREQFEAAEEMVRHCQRHGDAVIDGLVTPSPIT